MKSGDLNKLEKVTIRKKDVSVDRKITFDTVVDGKSKILTIDDTGKFKEEPSTETAEKIEKDRYDANAMFSHNEKVAIDKLKPIDNFSYNAAAI